MKPKTFTEKLRTNRWMMGTFMLGFLCIILIAYNFIDANREMNSLISPEVLCSKIEVTPSWADWDGRIIDVGYYPIKNQSKLFVDRLIEQRIHFIYNSNCGACVKQIEDFGADWERYVKSKLTIDCGSLR